LGLVKTFGTTRAVDGIDRDPNAADPVTWHRVDSRGDEA